jgi:osmotically-inducible protein OsmY
MNRWVAVSLMAAGLALGPAGCVTSGTEPATAAQVANEDVRREVLDRLQQDSVARHFNVGVTVEDGVVTVTGRALDAAARTRITSIARSAPGVKGVVENYFAR